MTNTLYHVTLVRLCSKDYVTYSNSSLHDRDIGQRVKKWKFYCLSARHCIVTAGSSAAQFSEEARQRSKSERDALLEGLQGGMKVMIPPLESLAMKAGMVLPWSRMRQIRRYNCNLVKGVPQFIWLAQTVGGVHCVRGEDEKRSRA